MRKLAWLALIIFIAIVIVATLGAVNYAGIGDAIGGFMQNTLILPVRNFFIGLWNTIGTSGWYIVIAVLAISLFGAAFWVPVFYGIVIKKGVQEKLLHQTPRVATPYQSAPVQPVPITGLQSSPTQTPKPQPPSEPTPEKET